MDRTMVRSNLPRCCPASLPTGNWLG